MRASIYNAMPLEGVKALTDFMADFERRHGLIWLAPYPVAWLRGFYSVC
jgi:hypothetical protein